MLTHPELSQTITRYFDAIYYCDSELMRTVFHPQAQLFDADGDGIFVEPVASFIQDVATRPSPASISQVRQDKIISVDWLSAKSAWVKLELWAMDKVFVDHLNLLFDGHTWKIVAKVWHLTSQQPPITLDSN